MGLSKVWLVVLTLVAGMAAALAVLAPWNTADELGREIDARLSRTHSAASLLLRVNARKWIDTSARVASDAVLGESLDSATRGPSDLALVHKTVQDRLRYFNEQMKVDLVVATDAHGRVIARVGVDAKEYRDSIDGYPLVVDALRGLRGDDTWSIGGHLYRVAASPVILRDRYVGTVIIGQEATAELAESMKAVLGADVVLMLRGRILGATGPLPIVDQLPAAASANAAELARTGHSAPLHIGDWGVVFGAFVGEAGEHQALYALCTPRRTSGSLTGLVTGVLHRDPKTLPWRPLAPVLGGTLVALFVGLLLLSSVSRPITRLTRQAQALARGEITRLSDGELGEPVASLARAMNTTLERISGRIRAEARAQAAFDDPSRTIQRPRPPTPKPEAPSERTNERPRPSAPPATSLMASAGPTVNLAGEHNTPAGRTAQPEKKQARAPLFSQSMTPLPPPAVLNDTEPVDTSAPAGESTLQDLPRVPPATRPEQQTARELPVARRSFDEQPTSVQSPSEALLLASSVETNVAVEEDFRRVFEEFVETRRTCGEALEGVTFEKFLVKLRQNRTQLIQRYACADVHFQVYIKDGKAALKATPVT